MQNLNFLIRQIEYYRKDNYINLDLNNQRMLLSIIKDNSYIKEFFNQFYLDNKFTGWTKFTNSYFARKSSILHADTLLDSELRTSISEVEISKSWDCRLYGLRKIYNFWINYHIDKVKIPPFLS